MTGKEAAASFRRQLKEAGIKTHCRTFPADTLGPASVRISVPAFEIQFSEEEQRTIRQIALNMGLTLVRGLPIDVGRMTDPREMLFFLPV